MSDAAPVTLRPVLDPVSGEVVELGVAETERLAEFRDFLGDCKRRIDEVLVEVDAEVTRRLDADNVRSSKAGGFEVKTEAPYVTTWDTARLGVALEALVVAGKLTRKAATAALVPQPPPPPKPNAAELKKLLAHVDAEVVEAIDACRSAETRQRRRVTVKRTAPAQGRLSAAQGPQEGM